MLSGTLKIASGHGSRPLFDSRAGERAIFTNKIFHAGENFVVPRSTIPKGDSFRDEKFILPVRA